MSTAYVARPLLQADYTIFTMPSLNTYIMSGSVYCRTFVLLCCVRPGFAAKEAGRTLHWCYRRALPTAEASDG
jgi:hypothetical protein